MYRWLVLRLFWSILLLPLIAFVTLWILHELLFRGSYFPDTIIIVILALALFPVVSAVLTRIARRRFAFLEERGRELLLAGQEDHMAEMLPLLRRLFDSGLLSPREQEKCGQALRRSYFPFYASHLEDPHARTQLLAALREGVRVEEAYYALKSYVLNQPRLTMGTAAIAEELLDHNPGDQALANFFVRHFLENRSTHHRAEYFYASHLAHDGSLSDRILALCLEKILGRERRDDFAAWCYVRAFQSKWGEDPRVRRALYQLHEAYRLIPRDDALARVVAACASLLSSEEIERWRAESRPAPAPPMRQRLETLMLALREGRLYAATWLRKYQRWVWAVTGGAVLLLILLAWPEPPASKVSPPAPSPPAIDQQRYFSFQVGAVKERRRAERMRQALATSGLVVYIVPPRHVEGWYAIRVGRYPSQEQARAAADSLKAAGIVSEYFVTNYEAPATSQQ
ncbi:MAG: SPOR domain-containing protein [candidate division KSB1 bacterium]|nr:SPOR domain-containing protein [candidate division KSB1 bacterium]MDZ7407779.1 SPOR domain-containing protein [candidate division KSB1 bacterium]